MSSVKIDFPVQTDDAPATFAAHLYRARGRRRGILQVLVHGVSYDHRYWDAARINGEDYSYTGYMTERGYDVLAVDLPGVGASSRPGGDAVGFDYTADALARAVAEVRDRLGGNTLVALAGHSLGSLVAIHTQIRWETGDFLIDTCTGYVGATFPSPHGPGVREESWKEPYASHDAEHRARVFYHSPNADPDVIAYDNNTLRNSIPRRIWQDSVTFRDAPDRSGVEKVKCPVFIQLGEFDPVLPAKFAEEERALWPADTTVIVEQVEGVGHSLNLHRDPARGWRSIDRFLRS
ncbi:alpha/beta hydrolase [Amycolatopsis rubida]|uniref:Alpha/beta hydrolase n=1 Tax=Amycolatopsis rubida TaxID=112413 RepID=A0ABX0C195_9PSEU|nr:MULTISPECIES: alpha/beta hydrolase [Amycolatopsis]MYW96113.1 alpha/beta fold hydrolase [Amycolatopsis rubida]NEC61104.1 alpha/beta hydrolase [Amycolatopsis rubida]OAP23374.1 Alpha/beta hydrolase family protein [Amycolatopsis sp. M39]